MGGALTMVWRPGNIDIEIKSISLTYCNRLFIIPATSFSKLLISPSAITTRPVISVHMIEIIKILMISKLFFKCCYLQPSSGNLLNKTNPTGYIKYFNRGIIKLETLPDSVGSL